MTAPEILKHLESGETISDIVFAKSVNLDFTSYTDEASFFLIEFENCHFKRRFSFRNLKDSFVEVRFTNCKFESGPRTLFANLELDSLEFTDCSFSELLINEIINDKISFIECNCKGKINLLDCKVEDLDIINNQNDFIGEFVINSPNLQTTSIEAKKRINKISINSINSAFIEGNFDEIEFYIKKFDKIEIQDYLELDDLIPTKIEKLNFSNSNFEGDLTLGNIYINELKFESLLSSKGSVRMNEVDIMQASFNDCTISSFYWNQVNFINDPEIIRCDLSSLKISNVHWENGKKLKDSFLDEKIPWLYAIRLNSLKKQDRDYSREEISILKYQRDTYRQLKAASIANHNQIDALIFYKNEMNLYWKQIRIEGGEKWYDRTLIFLSKIVSNFGQNWFLPLRWLIGVHFIFMMCIFNWNFYEWKFPTVISYGNVDFGFIGEYFQLLNPIHKLPDYVNTDGGKIADFFMRIFGSYFIYHFIKASRKFLEK